MLSSLKNITTGLRNLDASSTVKATTESLAHSIQLLPSLGGGGPESYHENGLNFAAGAELLQRYESLLAQMHENQVTLAAKAETTDQRVRPVLERCNAQYRAINALYKELWTLPKILEGLTSFQQSLRAICNDIDNLEVLLAERNAEVEALELERWKLAQQHKLDEYRQIKRAELQRLEKEMQAKKKQLEKELVKGEEREKKKLEAEEEKYREACEAAFRHSMEEFKKYGPQAIPRVQVKESLAQVSLGALSDSELEQFLGSDDDDDDDEDDGDVDDLLGVGGDEEGEEEEGAGEKGASKHFRWAAEAGADDVDDEDEAAVAKRKQKQKRKPKQTKDAEGDAEEEGEPQQPTEGATEEQRSDE